MESNNIVIKMYLFYTQQKFTEDNPRAAWRLRSARAGVVVNVGKGSGDRRRDDVYFAAIGLSNECVETFPVGSRGKARIVDTNPTPPSWPRLPPVIVRNLFAPSPGDQKSEI